MLKSKQAELNLIYQNNTILFIFTYFTFYILTSALSLPIAVPMTLVAGAIFGWALGTVIVSFASSIGATLAFLMSRYLIRDWIQNRYSTFFEKINIGLKTDGPYYLFSLRLIPIFPFFAVNLVMGLTQISTISFYLISQVGMLLGTSLYVKAGTELANINDVKEITSPSIIFLFTLIGLLPLILKNIIAFYKYKKIYKAYDLPKKFDYNMIVIGGGSAGLVTAYIASTLKAKVALVEKNKMGGDCLNTGCVPSKALIRSAKLIYESKNSKNFGIHSMTAEFEFSDIMSRIRDIIKKIEPHDSVERYTGLGVNCFSEKAEILNPYSVKIGAKTFTTKNIVIATGARPTVPKLPGLEKINFWTSENIWEMKELPKKFLVLGGGAIGCEIAQSFSRLGSQVVLIERSHRILSREDTEVSNYIEKQFLNENIQLIKDAQPLSIIIESNKKYLLYKNQSSEYKVEFDEIFLALGRSANVKNFGLEELNIELSDSGGIKADPYLRTNYPNIYVCGDVTGPFQFTHTASYQAWYCAVNSLFSPLKKFKINYDVIPWACFTDPEIARVGLNETEAIKLNIPHQVTKYSIDDLDRAIVDSSDHGFIKVLTKPNSDKILGVSIVGSHASEIITEFITAMKHGHGLNAILNTIHIYPTLSESNKFVAGIWKRNNTATWIFKYLEKFHSWRR